MLSVLKTNLLLLNVILLITTAPAVPVAEDSTVERLGTGGVPKRAILMPFVQNPILAPPVKSPLSAPILAVSPSEAVAVPLK